MSAPCIASVLSINYGTPGKIVLRHGSREIALDMGLETPIVALVDDYNAMRDILAGNGSDSAPDGDLKSKIRDVVDDVDDDSISSLQDAIEEIASMVL